MHINGHIFKSNLKNKNLYIICIDEYVEKIIKISKLNCFELDIKNEIIDNLDLIFELYCDKNDTRLHEIFLKYDIQNYLKLMHGKNINNYI